MNYIKNNKAALPPAKTAMRGHSSRAWTEGAIMTFVLFCVYLTSFHNYVLFHSVAELFSVFISITLFSVAFNCRKSIDNQYLLFIGIAYLFVGLLDLLHTLSWKGMPVFTDYDYYAPQFWIAARYTEAISMLLGFAFIGTYRRVNTSLVIFCYTAVTAALTASILYFKIFPTCFVPGSGLTPFKIYSEYLICGLLLASAFVLYRRRAYFDSWVYRCLMGSMVLMIIMEFCFTRYFSNSMSDFMNELGHILKVGAYYLIYRAVIVTGYTDPVNILFQDLKTSENNLRDAQQLARLGRWEWQPSNGILSWQGEIFKYFGWEESGERPFEEFLARLSDKNKNAVQSALEKCTHDGDRFELLVSYFVKTGNERFAQVRGEALREPKTQLQRITGTWQDVTDQQNLLAEIQRAKASADTANSAKSVFLANMSHEIRTPMTAIIGLAHLLRRDATQPRQIEQLNKISDAAQHLLGIINDILDFSKIEAGKMHLEVDDFSLESVFQNLHNMVCDRAETKGVEIITRIDPSLPVMLRGDRMRLGQVLLNFANNAIKFTEHGTVILRALRVPTRDSNEIRIRFEATDTGIGLSEEQQTRLFLPFEQADVSTTRTFGGTGLGLAICQRLAHLMGGSVGVDSTLGVGSTFWLDATFKPSQLQACLPPLSNTSGLKVLVVDDLEEARETLGDMLRTFHCHPTLVDSGGAALAELEESSNAGHPYDLVVLDWKMPGMDGIEATREIRRRYPEPPPGIILVTAYGKECNEEMLSRAGIASALPKPVTPSSLLDAIVESITCLGARPSPRTTAPAIDQKLAPLRGRHVLLAEDNLVNREVALELLRGVGLIVDAAEDGLAAVKLARQNDYDIILMDIQMPHLDGLAACRKIRRMPGRESVPVLAMTANAFEEDRLACLEAGMNDHIAKPFDPEQLCAILLRWLPVVPRRKPADTEPSAEKSAEAGGHEKVRSRLAEIASLDVAAGLKVVSGNWASYIRILRIYAENHADDGKKLKTSLAKGDLRAVQHIAHSLKGASANIGANSIRRYAQVIEQGSPDVPQSVLDELGKELGALVAGIRNALDDPARTSLEAPLPLPEIRKMLALLFSMLAIDDIQARQIFRELRPQLEMLPDTSALEALSSAIEQFSYSDALKLLKENYEFSS